MTWAIPIRRRLFGYVARELGKRQTRVPLRPRIARQAALGPALKEAFGGVFIANEGFTAESAREAIASGKADAVAFGKPAIANPDLVERIRANAPWNPPDPETFYGQGPKGYTDYPSLQTINPDP